MRTKKQPTIIDLFSGAGGFSLGFSAAGCFIQAAADIDEEAGKTFARNLSRLQPKRHPRVFSGPDGDLETLALHSVSAGIPPDILIGGPPCQPFSRIGRAKLDSLSDEGYAGDARNELYQVFINAAALWMPKAVVMENVPGMLSVDGRNLAYEAAADLASRGYKVGYAVLNAAWFGVPQFRDRLFMIGVRQDLGVTPVFPKPTHRVMAPAGYVRQAGNVQLSLAFSHAELQVDLGCASLPATTVHAALADLPPLMDHLDRQTRGRPELRHRMRYQCQPLSGYARLMRHWPGFRVHSCIEDHTIRRTPRDYETFGRMKPGDRYPEAVAIARMLLEEELDSRKRAGENVPQRDTPEFAELERQFVPPYPVDMFLDKWRKLSPDQPSWTVTAHLAKDSYSHIHYDSDQKRAISVREAARLQSFPDGFKFDGNMGDCFRQIGNAVPPLLAWAIAARLLSDLGLPAAHPPW